MLNVLYFDVSFIWVFINPLLTAIILFLVASTSPENQFSQAGTSNIHHSRVFRQIWKKKCVEYQIFWTCLLSQVFKFFFMCGRLQLWFKVSLLLNILLSFKIYYDLYKISLIYVFHYTWIQATKHNHVIESLLINLL